MALPRGRVRLVWATRAGDELYLSYPVIEETRDGPSHMLRPSKFLLELDTVPAVFDRSDLTVRRSNM